MLTDTRDGQAIAFNYGLFDFNQQDFIYNFARGRMNYMAAAWPLADDLSEYEDEGRWIVAQRPGEPGDCNGNCSNDCCVASRQWFV